MTETTEPTPDLIVYAHSLINALPLRVRWLSHWLACNNIANAKQHTMDLQADIDVILETLVDIETEMHRPATAATAPAWTPDPDRIYVDPRTGKRCRLTLDK